MKKFLVITAVIATLAIGGYLVLKGSSGSKFPTVDPKDKVILTTE